MYDKLEKNDSLASWMIAGGARLDQPDARHIGHLVALRDARRETAQTISPLAWLTARLAPKATVAASAVVASGPTATASANCCAPA
jgi:hypothetical protein